MRTLYTLVLFATIHAALLIPLHARAQGDYYLEVRLDDAVRAIRQDKITSTLRSHIEGAAAALSYAYDCSTDTTGFLRRFDRLTDALVKYSESDWGKLDLRHGVGTVAGTLHYHVTERLKCRPRN